MRVSKLKKNNMGQIDYGVFYSVVLLLAVGVVMVYSASSYYAMFRNNDSMYFLKRQLVWAVLGMVVLFTTMSMDYHKIKKYTFGIMVISIPLLLVVFLFPGVNGAQRWIQIGPLSFQPSELAKYVVVLFLAKSIEIKGD